MRYRSEAVPVPLRLISIASGALCVLAILLNAAYFSAVAIAGFAFLSGYTAARLAPTWSPRRKRRGRRRSRGARRTESDD